MNTYKISYQFPGSSYEDAVVTAPDQRAAEKAFKASFKGTGLKAPDIFNVELVAENTPATKDQEREALEKIKAILDTLGPDSYVGTAFEGCLEIAEENIENDFAFSMKQRVEAAVVENSRLKERVKELEDKLAESEKDYEAAHAAAHLVADEKDAEIQRLKTQVQELSEKLASAEEALEDANEEAGSAEARSGEAQAEIVRLKAKLYDYMTAGA
jgi:DNA repair exonuclease SbcCD ATPase subunit